jgi:hypothetical protein
MICFVDIDCSIIYIGTLADEVALNLCNSMKGIARLCPQTMGNHTARK